MISTEGQQWTPEELASIQKPYQLTEAEQSPEPTFTDFKASLKRLVDQGAMPVQPETADATPHQIVSWRVSQLARTMCNAQGYDPDAMVVDISGARTGPFGSVLAHDSIPAWTLFIEAAQRVTGVR